LYNEREKTMNNQQPWLGQIIFMKTALLPQRKSNMGKTIIAYLFGDNSFFSLESIAEISDRILKRFAKPILF
jgi:hypothetical protein